MSFVSENKYKTRLDYTPSYLEGGNEYVEEQEVGQRGLLLVPLLRGGVDPGLEIQQVALQQAHLEPGGDQYYSMHSLQVMDMNNQGVNILLSLCPSPYLCPSLISICLSFSRFPSLRRLCLILLSVCLCPSLYLCLCLFLTLSPSDSFTI